jgi:Holliday junction resolvase
MTEADIQRAIRKEIERRGGKCIKIHGNEFTVAGTPDLLGGLDGRPFAIEVKRPGGKPTLKQAHELAGWEAQGWAVGIAHSVQDALQILGVAQ